MKPVTLYYDLVTLLDYAWVDAQGCLIGDSLQVDVELTSTLDHEGMVLDFSQAKKYVKEWIDREIDHRVILPQHLNQADRNKPTDFKLGHLDYTAPAEAMFYLRITDISQWHQEGMQQLLIAELNQRLTRDLSQQFRPMQAAINLRRSDFSGRIKFHYTHGLKQHLGNCQRLWHGHESVFEINVKDKKSGMIQRCFGLERELYEAVFHCHPHFVLADNVTNLKDLAPHWIIEDPNIFSSLSSPSQESVEISYQSSQGQFYARLPRHQVVILPTETTVELLAQHLAQWLRQHRSEHFQQGEVLVKISEGISKGAVSIC